MNAICHKDGFSMIFQCTFFHQQCFLYALFDIFRNLMDQSIIKVTCSIKDEQPYKIWNRNAVLILNVIIT